MGVHCYKVHLLPSREVGNPLGYRVSYHDRTAPAALRIDQVTDNAPQIPQSASKSCRMLATVPVSGFFGCRENPQQDSPTSRGQESLGQY